MKNIQTDTFCSNTLSFYTCSFYILGEPKCTIAKCSQRNLLYFAPRQIFLTVHFCMNWDIVKSKKRNLHESRNISHSKFKKARGRHQSPNPPIGVISKRTKSLEGKKMTTRFRPTIFDSFIFVRAIVTPLLRDFCRAPYIRYVVATEAGSLAQNAGGPLFVMHFHKSP